jgi:hypothetical protein
MPKMGGMPKMPSGMGGGRTMGVPGVPTTARVSRAARVPRMPMRGPRIKP